jgi:hypothetical protein
MLEQQPAELAPEPQSPIPPPLARLFFVDRDARNCSPATAYMWT